MATVAANDPSDPVWRARFRNTDGLMTTIYFAVASDGVVHHAPKCFNHMDGIAFKRVKQMLKKIDADVEIKITNVRAEYGDKKECQT